MAKRLFLLMLSYKIESNSQLEVKDVDLKKNCFC